jgi:hypothetical protein
MRRITAVGAAMLAALMLGGCSQPDVATTPTPTDQTTALIATSPTPTPSQTGPTSATTGPDPTSDATPPPPTSPVGMVDTETGETIGAPAVPVWDDAARADVVALAENVMRAFAQPDLDFDAWYSGVEPLMTQRTAEEYAFVDPVNIPVREVTGPGRIVDDKSAYLAVVEVPTDIGLYQVVVVRMDGNSPWMVERLDPPQ